MGHTLPWQWSLITISPVNIVVLEQYRPSTEVIAGMVPVHHWFTATFVTVIYRWAKTYIPRFCSPVGILGGLNIFPVVLYPGGWLDIVKGLTFPNKYLSGG